MEIIDIYKKFNSDLARIQSVDKQNIYLEILRYESLYLNLYSKDFECVQMEFCYKFWRGLKRLSTKQMTSKEVQIIYALSDMYRLFFDIFLTNNKVMINLNRKKIKENDNEYVQWLRYFEDDIMKQFVQLFLHNDFEFTYSMDSLVRGLRVIEENLYFWLLVMECSNKTWNPEIIKCIYERKRNISRIEVYGSKIRYSRDEYIVLNGTTYNENDYVKELKKQNKEHEALYSKFIQKRKIEAEKKLKKKFHLSNKNIQAVKAIKTLNKQSKLNELSKIFKAQIDCGIFIVQYKNGKRIENKLTKNEATKYFFKVTKVLYHDFNMPKDLYEHIENTFTLEMIVHDKNVGKISGFHEYMKEYTLTDTVTRSANSIEFNMSNHAMFESLYLDEISILVNKVMPINEFLKSFRSNYMNYIQLICKNFLTESDIKKLKDEMELK